MTGIREYFAELSEPDFYDVSAQLELWAWREREAARERARLWYAIVKSTPTLREARNAYHRSRSAGRREYWRDHKRTKRGAVKQTHHCSACGGAGHRVTTCELRAA